VKSGCIVHCNQTSYLQYLPFFIHLQRINDDFMTVMFNNEIPIVQFLKHELTLNQLAEALFIGKHSKNDRGATHAIAIAFKAKDCDKIIYKTIGPEGWHASTPAVTQSHVFRIYSVTKTMTSAIIFQLVEEGKLDLKKNVKNLIQELTKHAFMREKYSALEAALAKLEPHNDATLLDLIQHTSMIGCYTRDKKFEEEVIDSPGKEWSMPELLSRVTKIKKDHTPGCHYSDAGYMLLTLIIEMIEQKDYKDIFKERIFKPYQLNHTFLHYDDIPAGLSIAKGYLKGAKGVAIDYTRYHTGTGSGGGYSTLSDMVKWTGTFKDIEEKFMAKYKITASMLPEGTSPSHIGTGKYHLGLFSQNVEELPLITAGGYSRGGKVKQCIDAEGNIVVVFQTWRHNGLARDACEWAPTHMKDSLQASVTSSDRRMQNK